MKIRSLANCLKIMVSMGLALCVPGSALIRAASTRSAAGPKTESAYRAEARRYEDALKLIAQVREMKLSTPDDLKQAFALIDRAKPNLIYYRSKLVVAALSDSTFTSGIKKRAATKEQAESLMKELSDDQRSVQKIDGASALKTRLSQIGSTDAAVLREAATKLRSAADRLKKANHPAENQSVHPSSDRGTALIPAVPQEPVLEFALEVLILAVIVTVAVIFTVQLFKLALFQEDRDALVQCYEDTQRNYANCTDNADRQPFPLNLAAGAICYAVLLDALAKCMVSF